MLTSIQVIYNQEQIKLKEIPVNIPPKTKVIVTFLTPNQSSFKEPNSEPRKPGYWEGQVKMSDDFDVLPADILNSFYGE
jgi:hypothetical protein